jgi:hypothetical protein
MKPHQDGLAHIRHGWGMKFKGKSQAGRGGLQSVTTYRTGIAHYD